MRLLKEIRGGGVLPKGYGICWLKYKDWWTFTAAPMPLNILLRSVRRFSQWCRLGGPLTGLERALRAGYREGYTAGYARGHADGVIYGAVHRDGADMDGS